MDTYGPFVSKFSPDEKIEKRIVVQWSPHTAMECSNNELKTAAQSYFRAQLKANYKLWIANDSQCGTLILLIWNFVFIQICPFFKDVQDMQFKIEFLGETWIQRNLFGSTHTHHSKNYKVSKKSSKQSSEKSSKIF